MGKKRGRPSYLRKGGGGGFSPLARARRKKKGAIKYSRKEKGKKARKNIATRQKKRKRGEIGRRGGGKKSNPFLFLKSKKRKRRYKNREAAAAHAERKEQGKEKHIQNVITREGGTEHAEHTKKGILTLDY